MRKQQELQSTHPPPDHVWMLIQSRSASPARRCCWRVYEDSKVSLYPCFFFSLPHASRCRGQPAAGVSCPPQLTTLSCLAVKGRIMHSFCCHPRVQPRCAGSNSSVTACGNAGGFIACSSQDKEAFRASAHVFHQRSSLFRGLDCLISLRSFPASP